MMAEMDRMVGKLIDTVDRLGLAQQTLILFTTDNGTASKTIIRHENGKYVKTPNLSDMKGVKVPGGKGKLTDWGTRVPTLARWQGKIPPGKVSEELIDFSDFLPTFNEFACLPAPSFDINGRSFAGLLTGVGYIPRQWAYSEHKGKYWVRSKQWKLYNDGRIYNMLDDPDEKKPLEPAGDTPTSELARKKLRQVMDRLRGK